MLEDLKGKGILVHHWDTDGISSASIMLKYRKNKNIENILPVIVKNLGLEDQVFDVRIKSNITVLPFRMKKLP